MGTEILKYFLCAESCMSFFTPESTAALIREVESDSGDLTRVVDVLTRVWVALAKEVYRIRNHENLQDPHELRRLIDQAKDLEMHIDGVCNKIWGALKRTQHHRIRIGQEEHIVGELRETVSSITKKTGLFRGRLEKVQEVLDPHHRDAAAEALSDLVEEARGIVASIPPFVVRLRQKDAELDSIYKQLIQEQVGA
jgi:hypothetical protein